MAGQGAWTPEAEAILRKMVAARHSSGEIAKVLAPITRNAVVGKCARLGLTLMSQVRKPTVAAVRPPKRVYKTTEELIKKLMPATPLPVLEIAEVEHTGAYAVLALDHFTCRWPLGDPREDNFRFCCAPVQWEDRYCATHRVLSFMPSRVRDRRKEKV